MTRSVRYRFLARYARSQTPHLLALVVLSGVPAVLIALQPLPMKLFVDSALGDSPVTGLPARLFDSLGVSPDQRSLVVIAALMASVIAIATYVTADLIGVYWERVGAQMVRDVSCDIFDRLQRLTLLFHVRMPTGDSMSRITTDSSAVYTYVNSVLVAPVTQVLTIATVLWSAWRLNSDLTLLAVAMAPFMAVVSRWFSHRLKKRAKQARKDRVRVVSFVTHVVHSIPVVQAFTAEPDNLRAFRSISDRSLQASRRTVLAESAGDSVGEVMGSIGAATILIAGGLGVINGTATVGDLLVFVAYIRVLDTRFRGLLTVGRQLRIAEVGVDRLVEVHQSDARLPEPTSPIALPAHGARSPVVWDHISFGYESGLPVLQDVNLEVESGETIAIVGRTGAGKSTLVSLVPRLFDPWSGRLVLDGVDVRDASLSAVRSRVALVRQSPLILPVSVAENIALGRPGATRADIEWAAGEALASEFIESLPEGFDTVLAEDGSTLSGGQRQRLAIARAFLKDAPILILDEPTSALDPESEAALVESLRRVSVDRLLLVIAHRLSTVRSADRAIVLEGGRIVEEGTHDELVRADGRYANFHRLQMIEAPR